MKKSSTRKLRGGVKNTTSSSSNPKPIPPDGIRRTTRSTGYKAYRIQLHAWLKKEEEKKNKRTQRKEE